MAASKPVALPTINGVGPSCVALPKGGWLVLLDFLAHRFPNISPDEWEARMQRGDVRNAQGEALKPHQPYQPYSKVYYYRSLADEPVIPFEENVLFQDDYLLVVDKPHFLPVTPSGRFVQETLLVRLKHKLGIDTLAPMHRIDRDTAGLVAFTLQAHTRKAYQELFRDKAVSKTYEAIAPRRDDLVLPLEYASRLAESPAFMQMCEVPGQANAHTRISLLEINGRRARYRLQPVTGQKHQLRLHMAALGIPIENDRIYPHLQAHDDGSAQQAQYDKPLKLLAKSLAFCDPLSGRQHQFESRLSLEF